jgi:hypothetical protein
MIIIPAVNKTMTEPNYETINDDLTLAYWKLSVDIRFALDKSDAAVTELEKQLTKLQPNRIL